jgi:hypothetical protein
MHGGKSLAGPASRTFTTGRHSKYLPARLIARYQAMVQDAELLALRDEIALVDARIADVLQRVESGESSRIWRELAAVEREGAAALRRGEGAAAAGALARLRALIAGGNGDWAAWADVLALIRERTVLVETERRRLVQAQHLIAVEDAMAVMGLLIDAVRRHVRDDDTLRAISVENARLVGQPAPLASGAWAKR